jgi:hypothetical protein
MVKRFGKRGKTCNLQRLDGVDDCGNEVKDESYSTNKKSRI